MSNLTKTAIRNSLVKLLNERPISKITIKDITDDCGINRNTFYYHYSDLPSLISEIVNSEADRIINQCTKIDSIEECLNVAISFAHENKTAVLHIHNSSNREIYESYLWRVCEHITATFINTVLDDSGMQLSEADKAILIRYYKCTCFGAVLDWLGSGMNNDIISDFKRLCELMRELKTNDFLLKKDNGQIEK